MFGPKPQGFWSERCRTARPPLKLDQTYRVTRAFLDFDQVEHPPGETWRFVGSNYLPYDNGLSLFVQTDEGEWHIRLQLHPEEQATLWGSFSEHIERV